MKNLVFMLWMLLFPLISIISSYIDSLYSVDNYSDGVKAFTALIMIILYVVVGILLYEK